MRQRLEIGRDARVDYVPGWFPPAEVFNDVALNLYRDGRDAIGGWRPPIEGAA